MLRTYKIKNFISKKGFRPGPAGSRGNLNFCPGVAGPNFSRFLKPKMNQIGRILSEIWLLKVIFWKTPKLVEIFTIFADSWRALAPEFRRKIVNNPLSFVFFWQITLHSHISLNIHPIWLIFGLKKREKSGPAIPGQIWDARDSRGAWGENHLQSFFLMVLVIVAD